jgi:hypothetical protein
MPDSNLLDLLLGNKPKTPFQLSSNPEETKLLVEDLKSKQISFEENKIINGVLVDVY